MLISFHYLCPGGYTETYFNSLISPYLLLDIGSIVVLWLNANFRTGFRKQKFGEKPGTFEEISTRRNKFSTAYMSFHSYINKNHKGVFEDFRGQNV